MVDFQKKKILKSSFEPETKVIRKILDEKPWFKAINLLFGVG